MKFTGEDLAESAKYGSLGPAYFDARRVVEGIMSGFKPEDFKPILDKITDQIANELWSKTETFLIADTESNIQGHIWRMVDNTVQALLTGEKWAMDRYVTRDNHDCAAVRKAVMDQAGDEVKQGRIADLEKQVRNLEVHLENARQRFY